MGQLNPLHMLMSHSDIQRYYIRANTKCWLRSLLHQRSTGPGAQHHNVMMQSDMSMDIKAVFLCREWDDRNTRQCQVQVKALKLGERKGGMGGLWVWYKRCYGYNMLCLTSIDFVSRASAPDPQWCTATLSQKISWAWPQDGTLLLLQCDQKGGTSGFSSITWIQFGMLQLALRGLYI